ncbi:cellulase family glycosylhydrolase [uncultured Chitinophaga sp.]|uniref:cellulase family glycosylhydrolase n=1 Tax=uncultured Chitinophaga sp. TaxID=339340 RepID=UPI0025D93F08|nr:cellulase family glycosylhydrolase [uncultured Chitinophaga sp.]
MRKFSTILLACSMLAGLNAMAQKKERQVWSKEKANAWYAKLPWMAGADYITSNAINQLEMWQAETFDSAQIDKELGWAESIGMNVMRVYLHHLAWQADAAGFKKRINTYLSIAAKHKVKTVFVLFDDCWNNTYKTGKQPAPKPGVHNSGWVQDPGLLSFMDLTSSVMLEKYVKDILQSFRNDDRILLWDLYNEPGNSGYGNQSMPLLKQTFTWGRQVDPSQPLSAGVWALHLKDLNKFQLENSDVITYHNYAPEDQHQRWIDSFLVQTGRPLICTEYMARTRGSRFDNIMPILKKQKIAAINWGFVAGKSNTIYAWDTPMPDGAEPKVWFHDIFRTDGTPYSQQEVDLIKQLTGKK